MFRLFRLLCRDSLVLYINLSQDINLINISVPDDFKLPVMRMVRQRFDLTPAVDVPAEIER